MDRGQISWVTSASYEKWDAKKKIAKSDNGSNNHGLSDTGFMGLMKTQWT